MDGVTLIHRARDAGLRLEVAGNAVKITGPKEAEPFVKLLAKHKAQVLEALTNSGLRELRELRKIAPESLQGDLPPSVEGEARRDRFEERAAILEFDEGLPRAEAEATARREMAVASTTIPRRSAILAPTLLPWRRFALNVRPTSMRPTGSSRSRTVAASSRSGGSGPKLSVGPQTTCSACTARPKSQRPITDDCHATTSRGLSGACNLARWWS